tara:strand:- start:790 stop:1134 length:345 start_codon:yes stop_codon:yes gene_type:complete
MNYKKEEIKEHFNDRIKDYDWNTILKLKNDSELHHAIFNTDYYIIGTYKAKKWLGDKVLDIIGFIKDYEMNNFGECYTDLTNSEKIVNMYVYILGEEIVNDFMNLSSIEQYNKI